MSGGADPHLRRLVESAPSLDEAIEKLGKRTKVHPLGLGITAKRAYTTDRGKLLLPDRGDALDALKQVVSQSVLDLDEAHSQACWQILLGAPSAVIPMPDPTSAALAEQRLDVGSTDIGTLRQVALISVNKPTTEWDRSRALTSERIGGVGLLTLSIARPPGAQMAWMDARWATSTREFVSLLEPLYVRAGLTNRPSGARVAVVVNDDSGVENPDELLTALKGTALVSGLHLSGFVLNGHRHESILNSLKEERHGHLIVLGFGAAMDAVKATFRMTPAGKHAGRITEVSDQSPLESLRERLIKIAGVSAALQPILEPERGFFTMPIDPTACLHDHSFVYVQDENTGLWWTRDLDNHGGSVFKTYKMVNNELRFHADRDEEGKVIETKWKSGKRRTIPLSTLAPCAHPRGEGHIRVPHPDAS